MFKNILPLFIIAAIVAAPVYAEDAVFSNSETQQLNLQPLSYTSVPVVKSSEAGLSTQAPANSTSTTQNAVSNQNFLNAINNLDNAQVEIREQMAAVSALMAQSKTAYEAKKDEYNCMLVGYDFKDRETFISDRKDMITFALEDSCRGINEAFDRVTLKAFEGVITNIIWYGLREKTAELLRRTTKCKRTRI